MRERVDKLRIVGQHCRGGHCEEAISALEGLLLDQPANPELHHQLGICYSGACGSHRLVSIRVAISYLEHAISLVGPAGPMAVRARYLDSLGNAYLSDRQAAAAMPFHGEAAEIYRRLGLLEDWAREEYNLGTAYCDLPESGAPAKWQSAIAHFRRALEVRTKEKDPIRHAVTLQNLGSAYRELSCGDRPANGRAAIECYFQALRILNRASFPAQYAALHNNLGNAYLSLPGSGDEVRRNLRRALAHFGKALEVRNRAERPCDYGVTQFNRGHAYMRQADSEPAESLPKAATCFREAWECFVSCQNPTMAAVARANLELVNSWLAEIRRDKVSKAAE